MTSEITTLVDGIQIIVNASICIHRIVSISMYTISSNVNLSVSVSNDVYIIKSNYCYEVFLLLLYHFAHALTEIQQRTNYQNSDVAFAFLCISGTQRSGRDLIDTQIVCILRCAFKNQITFGLHPLPTTRKCLYSHRAIYT